MTIEGGVRRSARQIAKVTTTRSHGTHAGEVSCWWVATWEVNYLNSFKWHQNNENDATLGGKATHESRVLVCSLACQQVTSNESSLLTLIGHVWHWCYDSLESLRHSLASNKKPGSWLKNQMLAQISSRLYVDNHSFLLSANVLSNANNTASLIVFRLSSSHV